MQLFVWINIDNVSGNYHHNGGLLVIAKDLQAARESLKQFDNAEGMYIPNNCGAHNEDPSFTIKVDKKAPATVIPFPNAGCC